MKKSDKLPQEPESDVPIEEQLQELARLVGELLAREWLRRKRNERGGTAKSRQDNGPPAPDGRPPRDAA